MAEAREEFHTGVDQRLDLPVYEKPRSSVKGEYVWKYTDSWINFPWSVRAPVAQGEGQVLDT